MGSDMTERLFGHIADNFKASKVRYLLFLVLTLCYYAAMNASYLLALAGKRDYFYADPDPVKAVVGGAVITVIFILTDNFTRRASIFLFDLFFYMTFIPMSSVYACCDFDTAFYIPVAVLTAACAVFLSKGEDHGKMRTEMMPEIGSLAVTISAVIILAVILISFYVVGLPELTALDIDKVYALRFENNYITNKYFGYVLRWTTNVIIPFLLAVTLCRRNAPGSAALLIAGVLIYLYTGHKTILFSLPMTVGIFLIANFKDANSIFFMLYSFGMTCINALGIIRYNTLYSLLVRRVLMIPAFLKFEYYRFFKDHTRVGLGGTLWGSALGQAMPYERGIGHTISTYFFNNDAMNANTGFLAEGYYRLGMAGLVLAMVLFVMVLKCCDLMERRTSYVFTLTTCAYSIYTLNDGMLIDSLIFGPFTVLMLIMLFYSDPVIKENGNEGKIALQLR